MNGVVYYSNGGQSAAIARYLAENLRFPAFDIADCAFREFDDLALVFPVYCQNVPKAVERFLTAVRVENLTLVATYGRMDHGNVLAEIQKKYKNRIVAAAYVPTKHTYSDDPPFSDYPALQPLIDKIVAPSEITVPDFPKSPFADLFPALRSRLGVRIVRTDACTGCNNCARLCPENAIEKGIPDHNCIRCLKCLRICPAQALSFRLRLPLKLYLRKKPVDKLELFL